MRRQAVWLLLAGLLGCSDTVSNVAGNYTLAVTNGANGCAFMNFMPGATASGVPFNVTQDGASVTGVVGGGAGLFANLVLGSATLTGTVSSTHLSMMLRGTRELMQGQCRYTVHATVEANLLGDTLLHLGLSALAALLMVWYAVSAGLRPLDRLREVLERHGIHPPARQEARMAPKEARR